MQQLNSKHKCEDACVHAAAIGIGVAIGVDWNEWRHTLVSGHRTPLRKPACPG